MMMMMMMIIMMMMMMMVMIMMMLGMGMETTRMSSQMSDWRCKINNTQNQRGTSFHQICKESKLMIWRKYGKKQTIQTKSENCAPTQSVLQWLCTCDIMSFCHYSNLNSPDLPITCCLPIFMTWVLMMLQITYVLFVLGPNFKERSVWTTLPLAYLVGSMKRVDIPNYTIRTIICLKFLFLLTTVAVIIIIM